MRKFYIITLVVLACVFAVSGIFAAADWYREDRTTNIISVGELSGDLIDIYEQGTIVMPGDRVSKVVSVKNSGSSDGLVRVRLESMWADSGEETAPEQFSFEVNEKNWLFDAGTGYYYYLGVLAPGETTEPLLDSFSVSGPELNNYYSYRPGCILVTMEMVQAAAEGISLWDKTNSDLGIEYQERPGYSAEDDTGVDFEGPEDGFLFGDNGDLFASFKNILPGQTIIQRINVGSRHGETTEIFLKATPTDGTTLSPETEAQLTELLTKYVDLKVSVGGNVVYRGPVWQDGVRLKSAGAETAISGLYDDGISLGRFYTGDGLPVTVELELSRDVGNEFQNLAGEIDWVFSASGTDQPPIPQTGDKSNRIYLIIMLAAGAACLVLMAARAVAVRKKRGGRNVNGVRFVMPVLSALLLTGLLIGAAILTGGTSAFMTDAESCENEASMGELSIELSEPSFVPDQVLHPCQTVDKDPQVTNTGSVPALVYLKVTVPIKRVKTVSHETKMILPAESHELFSFAAPEDWLPVGRYNRFEPNGDHYAIYVYGYRGVLGPGETTPPLFETVTFINLLEGELPAGTEAVIDIDAYGLQSEHIADKLDIDARLQYGYDKFFKE
ncbi:MAG: hypothetical protein J5584_05515 [Clostridia bacterium]|nr:hypothetical protein [Clostridia bacterium]